MEIVENSGNGVEMVEMVEMVGRVNRANECSGENVKFMKSCKV